MEHEKWMELAFLEAGKAEEAGEIPVGAVIVRDGNIVSSAHNEREGLCDPTAHAEILALRRAAEALGTRRLNGCTLYVTLEPCPMCAGAILMSGVEKVVYSAGDPEMGCAGSVYALPEDGTLHGRCVCIGGILEEKGKTVLKDFFTRRRNIRLSE